MTCNTDCEHPEYEVAAFVMNRLLGFNNMPITVGRQISWFDDVFPVASKRFGKEMTIKNGTDVCFKWRCPSTEVFREFCFHKGIIFGSATIWLNKAVHIVYPYGQEREKYEYHDFHLYAKAKEFCLRSMILLGAPIYQCCSIRRSTFDALYRLKNTLTEEFENETRDDPIYPLLLPKVFLQMQARLKELVSFLDFCIAHKGLENVVFD
ncbi:hypothetical protein CHS0354_004051 [Potamilus streckersoni]|uniref:FAM20 C-terminal domain-containing protein n=1 Tax=Potamilus streckersoni TaxID=2493646 RepID=A0AAE0T916_9BIVA|nr:hypothetical protein CHS0354_004051 [Potamilus streckersoni]